MTDQHIVFRHGDRVDIVIRNAEVTVHGDGEISFGLDGLDDDVWNLPVRDAAGQPLPAVSVSPAMPTVRGGDLWSTRSGYVLFATQYHDGTICMVTPDGRPYTVPEVLRDCGPIDLVVHQRYGAALDVDERPAMFDLPNPDPAPAGPAAAEEEPPVYREVMGPHGPTDPWHHQRSVAPDQPADTAPATVAVGIAPVVPIVPGAGEPAEPAEAGEAVR